jgi:hypothetical protein
MAALEAGSKVARAVWTGGMYLIMVFPIDPSTGKRLLYVFDLTVNGTKPWLPTTADMNATDWSIVP